MVMVPSWTGQPSTPVPTTCCGVTGGGGAAATLPRRADRVRVAAGRPAWAAAAGAERTDATLRASGRVGSGRAAGRRWSGGRSAAAASAPRTRATRSKGRSEAESRSGAGCGPRAATYPKAEAMATRPMTATCVTARETGRAWVSRRSGRCGSGNTNAPQRCLDGCARSRSIPRAGDSVPVRIWQADGSSGLRNGSTLVSRRGHLQGGIPDLGQRPDRRRPA